MDLKHSNINVVDGVLKEHFGYVSDSVRTERFQAAIAKVVRHGDRIVDLGCGAGILGLLCLHAGAGHVSAIDSTAMLEVARKTLLKAGYGEKATFLRGHSFQVELLELADVVICDHVGYFGFDYGIVQLLQDAKKRFLKSGGALIPARIKLHIAAAESEQCRLLADGWRENPVPCEFHWLHAHSVNAKYGVRLQAEELLTAPVELANIDLCDDNPSFFSWTVELHVARAGVMHGVAGWFECELTDGVWMTNSPLSTHAINRPQVFLPIAEAVELKAGDAVSVTLMAHPEDQIIAWQVKIPGKGLQFEHSTWHGKLLTLDELKKRLPMHIPRLNRQGQARAAVLGYCNGQRTLREIEQAVLTNHPDLFPTDEETLRFVAQVLAKDAL